MGEREDEFYESLRKEAQAPGPARGDDDGADEAPVEAGEASEPAAPTKAPERSPAPLTRRNLFEHHDAHPLLLDIVLLEKYGPIWLDWEFETLWSEIEEDFEQATISVHNRNKVQATRTCHLVDTPWEAWETFVIVCQAFNNNVPNFRTLYRPSPAQIMCAVDIMRRLRKVEFSEEVGKFIAACFLDEGVVFTPPPVDFAQEWASRPVYKCKDCGRVDRDYDNDVCDSCGASQSSLVKELERDFRPVQARYEQIIGQGEDRDELQETPEDVQTAKLLIARDYVRMRRDQLQAQLTVIQNGRT